ncbi:MAG: NADP-dependent malic enzyme [Deltaproteobacteria bacterium]|jgi:malate dehydrogenase (oxaloacetate-decarboxylating)|nr:NADP-dependent malic enzyme [Deltaproteobacteria bacterium]
MDYAVESLRMHRQWRGKLETVPKMAIKSRDDLALAYTPGVASPCLQIFKDPSLSFELTGRWNTVAVVTDGTAVLGLGDIGPEASMPVMEGKCVLFKAFGGVDAVPICIRSKDVAEIVNVVALMAGSFGGINLEDIAAPRCFEIEKLLKERCDIPVFHDDQHGTAVVVLGALINALKIVGKRMEDITVVTNGAGAAGTAIVKLLLSMGLKDVIMCDRQGAISLNRPNLTPSKRELAEISNKRGKTGTLADVIAGADAFVGVSAPGMLTSSMIKSMAEKPIIFPMANPIPEIMPEEALKAGAAVLGTGRSDFPNQINNVLAFPGIFRGVLDVRARDVTDKMKVAAAEAIANIVTPAELKPDYIIPAAFDPKVREKVAEAVANMAIATGVARVTPPKNGPKADIG